MSKSKNNADGANGGAVLTITAPRLTTIEFHIRGTSPLVMNKFSAKAREAIKATQMAGSQAKSKKKRDPKDFDECFRQAIHYSEEGWIGIPAPAFRAAMIDVCRMVGFKMTHAKMSVWVEPDGIDADEGTPLVRLIADEPEVMEAAVRNQTGVVDLRVRPMWRRWEAKPRITFDEDQFSAADVGNLLARAGLQVGLLEGRPFSKNSHGQGWGQFRVLTEDDK